MFVNSLSKYEANKTFAKSFSNASQKSKVSSSKHNTHAQIIYGSEKQSKTAVQSSKKYIQIQTSQFAQSKKTTAGARPFNFGNIFHKKESNIKYKFDARDWAFHDGEGVANEKVSGIFGKVTPKRLFKSSPIVGKRKWYNKKLFEM